MGWVALKHVGFSGTRDGTRVHFTGRQTPNHWTSREAPGFGFWSQILVQIQALPWTSSVTANKSLAGFQSPVRWRGSYLFHCFAMSVNKLAHIQYPIQAAAFAITLSTSVLQYPLMEEGRKVPLQAVPGHPSHIPKDVNHVCSLPPCNQDLFLICATVPCEGGELVRNTSLD